MIVLDSSYDSWENKVLFVKIAARVLNMWLDKSFAKVPIWAQIALN